MHTIGPVWLLEVPAGLALRSGDSCREGDMFSNRSQSICGQGLPVLPGVRA